LCRRKREKNLKDYDERGESSGRTSAIRLLARTGSDVGTKEKNCEPRTPIECDG